MRLGVVGFRDRVGGCDPSGLSRGCSYSPVRPIFLPRVGGDLDIMPVAAPRSDLTPCTVCPQSLGDGVSSGHLSVDGHRSPIMSTTVTGRWCCAMRCPSFLSWSQALSAGSRAQNSRWPQCLQRHAWIGYRRSPVQVPVQNDGCGVPATHWLGFIAPWPC